MLGSQPTVDLRGEYLNLDHGCKPSVLHSLEQVVIQRFWDLPSGERYEVNEGSQVFRPSDVTKAEKTLIHFYAQLTQIPGKSISLVQENMCSKWQVNKPDLSRHSEIPLSVLKSYTQNNVNSPLSDFPNHRIIQNITSFLKPVNYTQTNHRIEN